MDPGILCGTLDATNASHVQGCTLTPPYFDEYGEADPGLR